MPREIVAPLPRINSEDYECWPTECPGIVAAYHPLNQSRQWTDLIHFPSCRAALVSVPSAFVGRITTLFDRLGMHWGEDLDPTIPWTTTRQERYLRWLGRIDWHRLAELPWR